MKKSEDKSSLMKLSLFKICGEPFIKAENVHFDPSDKGRSFDYNIALKSISSFTYVPDDYNGSSEGYSMVKGTLNIYVNTGAVFKFYNFLGGAKHITTPSVVEKLYTAPEADEMKKFLESISIKA